MHEQTKAPSRARTRTAVRPRKHAAPKISETAEHLTIASWVRKIGLDGGAVMFHLRGERMGASQRGMAARMGTLSKLPDWQVIHAGQTGFIELKPRGWRKRTAKTGTYTPHERAQLAMHKRLMLAGAWVEICESLDEVQDALVRYGVPLRFESQANKRLKRVFAEVRP